MKFQVGEVAIYSGPVINSNCIGLISRGDEVTLLEYDASDDTWMVDVLDRNGNDMWAETRDLTKRHPHEQPADEDFQADLNRWLKRTKEEPCEKDFNWKRPQEGMPILIEVDK